jgi:hypothetical protein
MNSIRNNYDFLVIEARHPHIATKIDVLWGSRELNDYMHRLMTDTRDGTRQGFAPEVAGAIFRIIQMHENLHPHVLARPSNPWNDVVR